MMVHILDNTYSRRPKGQPWMVFNHYNGDVYSGFDDATKKLADMAEMANEDSNCYDIVFDPVGHNLCYRWRNGDGDEIERYIQIETRNVREAQQ